MAAILLHLPDGVPLFDPAPDLTERRNVVLVEVWDSSVVGVVGFSSGGLRALRTASDQPELGRLVIASTPMPDEAGLDVDLDAITAKALLLFGVADSETGSRHGRAWQKALPNARLEMVPNRGHDLLIPMWGRILSHLAPRGTR